MELSKTIGMVAVVLAVVLAAGYAVGEDGAAGASKQTMQMKVEEREAQIERYAALAAMDCLVFPIADVPQTERFAEYVLAAITVGAKGSYIITADDVLHVDAYPVRRVIDTTGAGDLYAAGVLFGLTHGLGLATAGRLGRSWAPGSTCASPATRPPSTRRRTPSLPASRPAPRRLRSVTSTTM